MFNISRILPRRGSQENIILGMYGKGGKQSKKEKILSENGSREKYLDGIKLLKLNEFIFYLSIYLSVFLTG